MSSLELMLLAATVIPLGSFLLLALAGARLGKPLAGWVATAAIAASCVLSGLVVVRWQGMDAAARAAARSAPVPWTVLGDVPLEVGVNLDGLTVAVFFMVTFVSTWIHVFSIGYMAGHSDEIDGRSKFHRFFAFLSLFCFSMLGLVIADSLVLTFVFWELVGLCSYLLIGFYFHKPSASAAAIKAFVVNRVGDMGFILGLGMVFWFLGDLSLAGAARRFAEACGDPGSALRQAGPLGLDMATWLGLLLFCGAVGKSAQFPLHVWLPDAMEGPTPVSALIHAATMVAAGVYLVARIFVLLTPQALLVVAGAGCITLTLGALVAVVQTDIKKVLAYSTISQLGYMMLGMGVGAWIGALFHLLTHAFFKALMFLGSGQVIEGCHHEQDIRRMGGLWRRMPVTCATFLIGVLAIAGAGIPGTSVGLGGFFSKDEILAVAYSRVYGDGTHGARPHGSAAPAAGPWAMTETGHRSALTHAVPGVEHAQASAPLPALLFWVPVIVAYITPFYMMRCWWLTFMGRPRDDHVHAHARESALMVVPLVVLAAGTLVCGLVLFRPLVAEVAPAGLLAPTVDGHELHEVHHALMPIVGGAFVVGFAVAIALYARGLSLAAAIARRLRPLHRLLEHKFYFDELYGLVLVGGTHLLKGLCDLFDRIVVDGIVDALSASTVRLARFSGRDLDERVVDGAVNGVGRTTWELGGAAGSLQTGRIRLYILLAAGGVTAMVWLALAAGG